MTRFEKLLKFCLTAGFLLPVLGCEDSSAPLDDATRRLDVVFSIQDGGRWGAIDRDGAVLVEPTYDDVSYGFCNRSASGAHQLIGQQGVLLTSASQWCFVTADGARRINPISKDYWRVFNLGESLFAIEKQPSDRGYTADTRPPWVFRANVHPFAVFDPFKKWNAPEGVLPVNRLSEGLLGVVRDGKFGFADRNGTVVVSTKYEAAYAFSEGLAAVMLDSKWGFIDLTGELVIEPQFDSIATFDHGLAMVVQHGRDKPFFINSH